MKAQLKKWVVYLVSGVGILLVLGIVFILVEHFRGNAGLRARLHQLSIQGEKLNYRDLLSPLAVDRDATAVLSSLTNKLTPFFELENRAPQVMKETGPGRATVSWRQDVWPVDETNSVSWREFDSQIVPVLPLLDKLQLTWKCDGFDDGFDYEKGFVGFEMPKFLVFVKKQPNCFPAWSVRTCIIGIWTRRAHIFTQ